MNNSNKSGGFAALIQAAAFLLSPINFVFLLPSLGIDPTAIPNSAILLPVIHSPLLFVGSLIQFVLAATVVVIALTFQDRNENEGNGSERRTSAHWAVAAAVTGSTLLLITAILNVVALRTLPAVAAAEQTAFLLTTKVVGDALLAAAFVAVGWSFVLLGWMARARGSLPRPMTLLMILGGVAAILTFVIPPLRPLTALFNLAWSLWLAGIFLRRPATAGSILVTR